MAKEKSKYTSIGGQALIEGIMMRGKDKIAITVRKSDGELITKVDPIKKSFLTSFSKIPILRGIFGFIASMIIGIKALNYSAEFFDDGSTEKGKFDLWIEDKFGDKADSIYVLISMVFALVITVLFFLVLPAGVSSILSSYIHNDLLLSLVEGIFKFTLFLAYIVLISRMKEIRRVFEYHGAEHKTIRCFEAGEELTPENAKKYTRLHPRCGTSFLLIVVLLSVVIFSFLGNFGNPLYRSFLKLIFMPLVAGIAYELIQYAGKHDNFIVKIISWPGMMFQKITTAEPDDGQLEVAITALKAVLDEQETLENEIN
ncbi:DUF1385 domain-containing protein [Acidaminobacter sp. JC074]|uniref:DUF1385 domain-containing protein n=1 Tax=Acidaminobacter sp. JC074 TaxID=2530199 RepID=UPI001F0FB879|nr:DUF1385 domain-containing protein [Acidaminobacter sp. JC074]MCH4889362.1 DUF1385 domain-containing protein [Acidaminobacter sp. JC074]